MMKTITFAILHFSIAFTVTYLITGSWVLGGLVALIEPTVNTVAYFFHEKVWERVERKRAERKLQASSPEATFTV